MKKTILTILALGITIICYTQTTTKYYSNEALQKEVTKEKAKFSQTKTENTDGTITNEVKNVKKNEVVRSETYKGQEPFGIWIYQTSMGISKLDYNFSMKYLDENCNDSLTNLKLNDYFQDNDSLGYKAPKILTGQMTIYKFISDNLVYPNRALEEEIQGKVIVTFTISKEGNVENIFIRKGTNILLDKEAVRVLMKLKFLNPATIYGQPQSFCLTVPISFKLI